VGSTVFYAGSAELATLGNTFRVAGVATDPTAVTLVVTDPLGVATTYNYPTPATITRTSAGVYTKDIPCATAGTWTYEWTGTGAASDVEPGTWLVSSAPGSDLYCTPEQLKSRTGISDNLDDAEILTACRSVSRWIDGYCDRVFARRTATMQVDTCGAYSLKTPDLVSVTTLKTDDDADGVFENTWSVTDYELQPVNAAAQLESEPYTALAAVGSRLFPVRYSRAGRRPRAQIVGVFGWPSLPSGVSTAAGLLAADYLAAGGMKFGVMGFDGYAVRAKLNGPAMEMLGKFRPYPVLMA
jgi:hypothetical protein